MESETSKVLLQRVMDLFEQTAVRNEQTAARMETAVTSFGEKIDTFASHQGRRGKSFSAANRQTMLSNARELFLVQMELVKAQIIIPPTVNLEGKVEKPVNLIEQLGGPLKALSEMLSVEKLFAELGEPEGDDQAPRQSSPSPSEVPM